MDLHFLQLYPRAADHLLRHPRSRLVRILRAIEPNGLLLIYKSIRVYRCFANYFLNNLIIMTFFQTYITGQRNVYLRPASLAIWILNAIEYAVVICLIVYYVTNKTFMVESFFKLYYLRSFIKFLFIINSMMDFMSLEPQCKLSHTLIIKSMRLIRLLLIALLDL